MKKKNTPKEARRASRLSFVMAAALLFLSVVLTRGAVLQLRSQHTVSGCISAVGAVLFLSVCVMLCNDLRKQRKQNSKEEQV